MPGRILRKTSANLTIGHLARVGNDDLGAFAVCLDHAVRDDRMGLLGIGADDEDDLHVLDLADRIGHRTGTEYGGQPGHRRRVSETGAVIDVVCADPRADELLEGVIFLVRTAGRGESADGISAVLVPDRLQPSCGIGKGLVPGHFLELDLAPDKRLCEPVRAVHELVSEPCP